MRSLAFVLAVMVPLSASAQDGHPKDFSGSYLCRPIGAAGFRYEERSKEWQAVTFDTTDREHLIKFRALEDQSAGKSHTPEYRLYQVTIKRVGLPGDGTRCASELLPSTPTGTVPMFTTVASCDTQDAKISIDLKNLRYQAISDGGFLFDLSPLNPYIEVGKCVQLD